MQQPVYIGELPPLSEKCANAQTTALVLQNSPQSLLNPQNVLQVDLRACELYQVLLRELVLCHVLEFYVVIIPRLFFFSRIVS